MAHLGGHAAPGRECTDRTAEPEGSSQMPQVQAPGVRQPESPQEARTIYTHPVGRRLVFSLYRTIQLAKRHSL
jgi:hypothetical protein